MEIGREIETWRVIPQALSDSAEMGERQGELDGKTETVRELQENSAHWI